VSKPLDLSRIRALLVRESREATHWEGCVYEHLGCAALALCDELESADRLDILLAWLAGMESPETLDRVAAATHRLRHRRLPQ
jgi:hypothetical protein